MRKVYLLCIIVLTGMLSSSIAVADVPGSASDEEIVHSIFEYDIEYQDRARAVVEEKMYHWPEESYVRWRPVRIEPSDVLQEELVSDKAMPESLQLTLFHDLIVGAQITGYTYIEATGDAIWEGVIPSFEYSRVEITIVDTTDKLMNTEERIAFVIKIWYPPRHFYILPTTIWMFTWRWRHALPTTNTLNGTQTTEIERLLVAESTHSPRSRNDFHCCCNS